MQSIVLKFVEDPSISFLNIYIYIYIDARVKNIGSDQYFSFHFYEFHLNHKRDK